MPFPTHCPRCGSPTSVADEAYCANSDCLWNNEGDTDRSPPSPAGAVETLAAPAAPVTGENTRRQHNYLQWLHVVLFLGLDVEPRRKAGS